MRDTLARKQGKVSQASSEALDGLVRVCGVCVCVCVRGVCVCARACVRACAVCGAYVCVVRGFLRV